MLLLHSFHFSKNIGNVIKFSSGNIFSYEAKIKKCEGINKWGNFGLKNIFYEHPKVDVHFRTIMGQLNYSIFIQ